MSITDYPVLEKNISILLLLVCEETESLDTLSLNFSLLQLRKTDKRYDAFGCMRTGWGHRIAGGKPALMPLCPPQIPHDLTQD
jgi:hypothetical protein